MPTEPLKVIIVGCDDAALISRLRQKIEGEGHVIVNVGSVGHVEDQHKHLEALEAFVIRPVEMAKQLLIPRKGVKAGKGKSRIDKQNRWR